jgi:hypothetical protein
MWQVSMERVAVQLSSTAEECKVIRRRKGVLFESCVIVVLIEKMIEPLPAVYKSSGCVAEEQL